MASSSDFDGATLSAAKEPSTKNAIAAIVRIFMPFTIKPFYATDDKPKIWGG